MGKRQRWLIVVIGVGLVWWLWPRREPSWTVAATPDHQTIAPGASVSLTANVTPASALGDGWTWTWTAHSGTIEGHDATATFSSGKIGTHRVGVTVTSPRGTVHTAEVVVTVAVSSYFVGFGPTTKLVTAQDDPDPDVVRDDLPYRIADVIVDKPVVCRGEKTVVRLRAEHDEGKADWLLPVINGRVGWAVTMVAPSTKVGRYKIQVQLSDPDGVKAGEQPPYVQTGAFIEVKDCNPPASLWVLSRQEASIEEDVRFTAAFHGTNPDREETPASYVWDFGDGSAKATTTQPIQRHLYPNEEQRGPDKRVSTYLVSVDALDGSGNVLATGKVDVWQRNRIEEVKRSDHRLQLITVYHPLPTVDGDGNRSIDVTVKNLAADETAQLSSLEYRLIPCDSNQPPRMESHPVQDVFPRSYVDPRGSLAGQLRWAKDESADICNVDVSIQGTSAPGALPIEGTFSMRARVDGPDLVAVEDPRLATALQAAMKKLNKPYVSRDDLERLASQGEIDPVVFRELTKGRVP